MAKIGKRIIEEAFRVLEAYPEGVRYSDLVRQIMASDSTFNQTRFTGTSGTSASNSQ